MEKTSDLFAVWLFYTILCVSQLDKAKAELMKLQKENERFQDLLTQVKFHQSSFAVLRDCTDEIHFLILTWFFWEKEKRRGGKGEEKRGGERGG